jgi:murein DD-endopeptidase MepM/ murein hydrolase activator NlpD
MKVTVIIAAIVLVCCGCCGLVVFLGVTNASACAPSTTGGVTERTDGLHDVGVWRADPQVRNAAIIVATGQQLNVPARGWVIAVATAMQESSLTNRPDGDRDSVGLFQQRPSQGWGTPEQLQDPVYASTRFYRKLLTVKDWEQLPLTRAAQAVQRSAYPDAYAKYEHDAERVVAEVTGAATVEELPGASLANCAGSAAPGTPSASGWVQPVPGKIVSAYGPRADGNGTTRLHAGVDLEANRNDIIVAAAAGTVSFADCDRSTGNCDIDGSPKTSGCGWYVDVNNGSGIATRYCHMVRRPDVRVGQQVQAGQRIGLIGTSGRSSGPHLHFEVHEGVDCSGQRCQLNGSNSKDPSVFMNNHGAPLGATT